MISLIIQPYLSETMQRIVEPELMDDREQAEAYAAADFEQAHQLIISAFDLHFPEVDIHGHILDLGCGPGDISFRFAKHFPDSSVIGIDGSDEMIRLANKRKEQEKNINDRLTFINGIIPDASIPQMHYSAIVSNSLLHHLHHPEVLWQTVKQYASRNTKVLITDLFRPRSRVQARQFVDEYTANEPEILQRDFYNSLLAAFTLKEIEQQLSHAGLTEFKITTISDRHVLIFGEFK